MQAFSRIFSQRSAGEIFGFSASREPGSAPAGVGSREAAALLEALLAIIIASLSEWIGIYRRNETEMRRHFD